MGLVERSRALRIGSAAIARGASSKWFDARRSVRSERSREIEDGSSDRKLNERFSDTSAVSRPIAEGRTERLLWCAEKRVIGSLKSEGAIVAIALSSIRTRRIEESTISGGKSVIDSIDTSSNILASAALILALAFPRVSMRVSPVTSPAACISRESLASISRRIFFTSSRARRVSRTRERYSHTPSPATRIAGRRTRRPVAAFGCGTSHPSCHPAGRGSGVARSRQADVIPDGRSAPSGTRSQEEEGLSMSGPMHQDSPSVSGNPRAA
mmetsp:Transcript_24942/g.56911  ORF Transcript_24942/g.56911 Transcript_24942/m.56911 type:complete len:269 (-) Transcript_24942:1116-1922(-)